MCCRACRRHTLPEYLHPQGESLHSKVNHQKGIIMGTKKPRLSVTLPPHIDEVVTRMAHLQRRSRSSVIVDVLEAVHRPWLRSCALLEAARDAPGQVTKEVAEAIERETKELEGAFQTVDMFADWGQEWQGSDPPLVTRGSGTENQGLTKGHKGV